MGSGEAGATAELLLLPRTCLFDRNVNPDAKAIAGLADEAEANPIPTLGIISQETGSVIQIQYHKIDVAISFQVSCRHTAAEKALAKVTTSLLANLFPRTSP